MQTNGGATTDFGTYVTYNRHRWRWWKYQTLLNAYHEDSVAAIFLDASTVCISDIDLWRDHCGGEGNGTLLARLDIRAIRPFVFCESGPTIDADPIPVSTVQSTSLTASLHRSRTTTNLWFLYCRFTKDPQIPEVVIFSGAEKLELHMEDSLRVTSSVVWAGQKAVALFQMAFREWGRERLDVSIPPSAQKIL